MKEKERGEGPITKIRKVDDEERNDGMPSRNQRSKKGMEVEVETVDLNSTHLGFKKKAMKSDDGDGHASISARTAKRANNSRHSPKAKLIRRSSFAIYSESEDDANPSHTVSTTDSRPLDPETAALHSQICGLLSKTMAISRASSSPMSSLLKLVMQDQLSLKTQRNEREWVEIFDQVLYAGEVGRGCGVFGKVESNGMVCSFFCFIISPFAFSLLHVGIFSTGQRKPPLGSSVVLCARADKDQERATLIKAMMPCTRRRSGTKKYKQYYWRRPLDKISRWDPENEL